MPLKLGVNLPQDSLYDLTTDVVKFARAAEEIGYDSLWAYERILMPVDQSGPHGLYNIPDMPWFDRYESTGEALVTLAMAAAVTERIELGTGVLVPPLHTPFRLARTLATLDHQSGGRVIAGLGVGWSIDEFDAAAPRPYSERGTALDEFLDMASAVWGPDPVSFDNDRYRIAPATVRPKPARQIPIYLGGLGPAALRRIARRGTGWLPTGIPPEQVVAQLAQLREMAAEAARDPAEINCIVQVAVQDLSEVPAQGRQPFAGSPKQLVEDLAVLAEGGVHHVYVTTTVASKDVNELIDNSAAVHEAVRGAGL
ncbi:LLM class F420-dependent oxidoreductase [Micromonospora sp. 15K316]|uniref:LLM class F420-dependent oxidoreductase n=1 Tax=Micromonospora sp. 15K316 TaxID=2530376 RepID=UPI00104F1697|nr:LLM class F420-dependent oxidoreductase [Micromonospora sp. 15K316]TDC33749.1 LLM class F420-dependent oxidoreductase [Micromonospora sp. 15K316]